MSAVIDRLFRRLRQTSFVQAVRLIEREAALSGRARQAPVGGDAEPEVEAVRLRASERMTTVAGDIAAGVVLPGGTVELQVNLLGLAGAAPALPPQYSEFLLQRRRLRDRAMANFYNLIDHRALSFLYRIHRRHDRAMAYERSRPDGERDSITRMLLALGGLMSDHVRGRITDGDEWLAPSAGHVGGIRRSAATLEALIGRMTGRSVRIVQAEPHWIALPATEQTKLGDSLNGQHNRLGLAGDGGSAVVGGAVLDVQHHYTVELGPLSYHEFLGYCRQPDRPRRIGEICMLFGGSAYRPTLRLKIASGEVPALRLGDVDAPAFLGWTSWMRCADSPAIILKDCEIGLGTK